MPTCHAYGCEVEVTPELLMCKSHWDKVPSRIKQAIYALRGKPDVQREWRRKSHEAINAVAAKENTFPRPIRRDGMRYVCDLPEGYHSFAIAGSTVVAAGANLPTIFFNPESNQWEKPPLPEAPPQFENGIVYAGAPAKD